jgi:hypothetical protein
MMIVNKLSENTDSQIKNFDTSKTLWAGRVNLDSNLRKLNLAVAYEKHKT